MISQVISLIFSIIALPFQLVYNILLIPFTFAFQIISIATFIFTIVYTIISTILQTLTSLLSALMSLLFYLPAILGFVCYAVYEIVKNLLEIVFYVLGLVFQVLQIAVSFLLEIVGYLLWALKNIAFGLYSIFQSSSTDSQSQFQPIAEANQVLSSAKSMIFNLLTYLMYVAIILVSIFIASILISYCWEQYQKYQRRKRMENGKKKQAEKSRPQSTPEYTTFEQSDQQLKQTYKNLCCPINFKLIREPGCLKCGHTFQKEVIIKELNIRKTCPLCRQPSYPHEVYDNFFMKQVIKGFVEDVRKKGKGWAEEVLMVDLFEEQFSQE